MIKYFLKFFFFFFQYRVMFSTVITAACSINSKTKNRDNSTTLIILFILSLLLINTMLYFLEVFNAVELELASWSSLKLTFQIKHALLPSDSLIINNHNMTDNSVKKQFCCVELEIISKTQNVRFRTFCWLSQLLQAPFALNTTNTACFSQNLCIS